RFALLVDDSTGNVVSRSNFQAAAGHGIYLYNYADATVITRSSVNAAGAANVNGLWVLRSSSVTVLDSFIQAATAALVTASTGTVFGGDVIAGLGAGGYGLNVSSLNMSVTVSSSVISGGLTTGMALGLGPSSGYNQGKLRFSSNTMQGARFGVWVGTQAAGAQVWFTSNTVIGGLPITNDSYGLFLEGLLTGATFTNNAVVLRVPGSASGVTAFGVFAKGTDGLRFDHNRISNPGALTAGSYEAIRLSTALHTTLTFNDVNSTGTAFTNAYLLRLIGSTGVTAKNNVFLSSFGVTGTSFTVLVDANSTAGLILDYNDYFSSNTLSRTLYNGTVPCSLPFWTGAGCPVQDTHSLAAYPEWVAPGVGVEDFHPRSAVTNGRYPGATDGVQAATIDAGDPAEPVTDQGLGAEPAANGGRANQGSYGQTAQASLSQPGGTLCSVQRVVCKTCSYGTIQAGLNALPQTLTGPSCVVIQDAAVYSEQVTIQGFTMGNSSITIKTDPAVGAKAVVDPPSLATAAFQILNASVTIANIDVRPTVEQVSYGVWASSGWVTISSVNVDAAGLINQGGVRMSSWSLVEYSSITVSAAHGLWLDASAQLTVVRVATAAANGAAVNAMYLNGASSNTVSNSYASNAAGTGLQIDSAGLWNTVNFSTMTTGAGGGGTPALWINGASSNTVNACSVWGGPGGDAAVIQSGDKNTITGSTITTSGSAYTVRVVGGNYTTLTRSFVRG
ncbi:MAG: right-handed parallel beta-helix repeat-containing protein, partial [Candidatus Rokubacteria bacterium]|nr:right-handed parallel beta-helix repeat-containing protein [Candidatus Rokubacteria bacterium]